MVQEKILMKDKSKKSTSVVTASKKKKELKDYKESHPYGYNRYVSIAKQAYYLHTEAYHQITGLCRRSRLPKDVWPRIETTFLNSYGLSKLPIGLIVQEEIIPDKETGIMVKDGVGELLGDYVGCLGKDLKEKEDKVILMIKKWEKVANELQKEFKTKAKVGEDYDTIGRKRVKEDIADKPIEWK